MRQIKSKNTAPELIVRQLVHGMGYRFRLHCPGLPGKPDLVFRRLMKIIEVRGCFWHQHGKCVDSHIPKSRHNYWAPKLERNRKRDRANLKQLTALGFSVLIVWECEVKKRDRLAATLLRFLSA